MKNSIILIKSSKKDLLKFFKGDIICFVGFIDNKFTGYMIQAGLDVIWKTMTKLAAISNKDKVK